MAFKAEDGTGLADSNSYVSVTDADAYFADRNNAAWAAALTANKQYALIRATQAVDEYGGTNFLGYKSSSTQALEWPRTDAEDAYGYTLTGVPKAVKTATCEAASLELGTAGILTPVITGGSVIEETVSGAVTVKYSDGTSPSSAVYTAMTRALKPVLAIGSGWSLGVLRC